MKPWPAEAVFVPDLRLNLHLISWAALADSKPKKWDSHRLGLFTVIYGFLKILVDQWCMWVLWKRKNIKIQVEPEKKVCRTLFSSSYFLFEFSIQPKLACGIQVFRSVWTWCFNSSPVLSLCLFEELIYQITTITRQYFIEKKGHLAVLGKHT